MLIEEKTLSEVSDMLNSYYTEKLLGLQGVEVKNILENEECMPLLYNFQST